MPGESSAGQKVCTATNKKRPVYSSKELTIVCVKHGDKNLHGSDGYSNAARARRELAGSATVQYLRTY